MNQQNVPTTPPPRQRNITTPPPVPPRPVPLRRQIAVDMNQSRPVARRLNFDTNNNNEVR